MHYEQDFSDFTIKNYEKILTTAKEFYSFTIFKSIDWSSKFLLWRHDVDLSLESALVLAKIEYTHKVQATYLINLHSEFYNPLQSSQLKIINQLVELKHDIGIHFDCAFYNVNNKEELIQCLSKEVYIFQEILGIKPSVFSFHNPTKDQLRFDEDLYCGLLNTYSHSFKNVPYCSDSNGYWRHENLSDFIKNKSNKNAQVLTHPGWWQEKPNPPRLRVAKCNYNRSALTMLEYDALLKFSHRENYDYIDKDVRKIINSLNISDQTLDVLVLNGEFDLIFTMIIEKIKSEKNLIQIGCKILEFDKNRKQISSLKEFNLLVHELCSLITGERKG